MSANSGPTGEVCGQGLTLSDFRPAPWLTGGNAQTLFGPLARHWPRPATLRDRWELPDGDFVDVDRLRDAPADAPALLVLHGLEGSARAPYVRGMLEQARRHGMRAFALNFRSCSDEPNRLLRSYHSGETGDLDHAVRRLVRQLAPAPLVLAGFSLGGNVLVKWLGEQGAGVPSQVRAAVAISVPFDLALCAQNLDGPGLMRCLYRTRFLRTLKRKALAKAAAFSGLSAARVRAARTLREFDELVTAPVHGFAGAVDYWKRCSSAQFIPGVKLPLLLISSFDDPIVPAETLPREAIAANSLVTLEETQGGGHVGFVAGSPLAPRFWAEARALAFLRQFLPPR